jgi:hypothetical protein
MPRLRNGLVTNQELNTMGKRSTFAGKTVAAITLAACSSILGCTTPPAPPDTSLNDDDAAAIFAAVLAKESGGYLAQIGEANAIVRGGNIPRPEKRGGRSALRDTTFVRKHDRDIDGQNYAHEHRMRYSIQYTDLIRAPRDYYYVGNTETRLMDTIFLGTMSIPTISASDSGWSLVNLYDTDETLYHLQGRFFRYGTYTFPGSGKTFTGRIETTTLIPGVTVDPASGEIIDGDITMALKESKAGGLPFESSCTYIFRPNQPPKLLINGNRTYLLDTRKGTVTRAATI